MERAARPSLTTEPLEHERGVDHAARRRGALAWRDFVQSHRFCVWQLFEGVCKFSFLVQREKWTRWICVVTNYLNGCWIGYLLPRADGRGEIGRPWNQCGTPEEPATVEELCR